MKERGSWRVLGRRLGALAAAVLAMGSAAAMAPVEGYRVVQRLPHDPGSFTEGFLFKDGLFYEGTGLSGRSEVRVTEPATGRVVRSLKIAPEFFGEGIVDWGPYLLEWTWQSQTGFVSDRRSLRQVRTFHYEGEGWGMTHDARSILTSDGSATITFRDPMSFEPLRTITVHDGPVVIDQVNELEYIRGEIWANVWHTEHILRLSPKDGQVLAIVDLKGLRPPETMALPEAVLNGIAYDAKRDRVYVTGKQWPSIFAIRVEPGTAATAEGEQGKRER